MKLMKKIAVVYSTKFGHTKTYADWLKEDVDADVISVDSFNTTKMLAYKLIIFASGVYGDKLPIMDYIKKNLSSIPADKIMIMAVSWYTNDSEEASKKLIDENFPEQYKSLVPIYVLNSGLDKKKVPVTDKAKLIAAQMMIEKKDDRSSDDINALAIIKGYSDQTSRDNLASIKKGIEEFFAPKKKEEPAAEQKPTPASAPKPEAAAPALKPAPAPKPAPVSPAPEPAPVQAADEDDLSSSVAAAFKNLGAPKPAPAAPAPEPAPVQAADEDDLSSSVAAAFKNLGAPKPAPAAPATEPTPVQAADEDDLSSSVAAAFKNLGAPKPAPAAPAPEPAPVQAADEDDLSSSVAAAFKNLGVSAPKHTPAPAPAPEPVPVAEAPKNNAEQAEKHEIGEPEEPVVRFNSKGQVVVSSVLDAINSLNNTPSSHTAPEHSTAEKAEEKPSAVNTENAQNVQGNPDNQADPADRKNSYMELFASRRKKAAASAAENQAAPAAPESKAPVQETAKPEPKPELTPVRSTAPEHDFADFDLDISQTVSNSSEFTFSSPSPAESAPAASDIDLDGYDFIGEEQKPTVSKRVLNAVQDLAKAKAEAEKEAAKKAAEKAAKEAEEAAETAAEAVSERTAADNSPASSTSAAESAFEKMKRDMEALAQESEQDAEYGEVIENSEENDMYAVTTFQEEDEDTQDEIKEFVFEEPSEDGLDAFAFADTHDYYSGKTSTPEIARAEQPKAESNTELDLKKLQEQINASIEANKINRERMQSRYGKRAKETVNNPFAVQFDDEENPKNKKSKKQAASEPKRLSDPIDPDIFFSKPGKNKDFDMMSDTMPEIKFKH